jgi:hypothetical protein
MVETHDSGGADFFDDHQPEHLRGYFLFTRSEMVFLARYLKFCQSALSAEVVQSRCTYYVQSRCTYYLQSCCIYYG